MKKLLAGFMIAAAAILMVSCSGQPNVAGKWEISSINGEEVTLEGEKVPFLEFSEEGRMHGFTGCNIVNADYTLQGSKLTFGTSQVTMMAGPEENMNTERAVLAALEKTAGVKAENEKLFLMDAEGKVLVELNK